MRTIAVVLALLGSVLSARADIGPKPRMYAGGMEARGDMAGLEIEMTSEEVDVTIEATGEERHEKLVVDAVFQMTNAGEAVEIEEGFPVGPWPNMRDFRVEVDGKAVDFELVNLGRLGGEKRRGGGADEPGDYWYVWKANYAAKSPCRHVVHYEVDLHHRMYTGVETSYVLHTGAPWKNPIGKAVVRLRTKNMPASHVFAVSPTRGLSREGDVWTWTFENLEPTAADDIRIGYDSDHSWEAEVEELVSPAEQYLGAKFRMCARRLEAASRNGRTTMTDEELAHACGALKAAVAGAVISAEGVQVQAFPSDKYPTTSARWAEFLLETYPAVVELAEAHPKSAEAAQVLEAWTPLARALSEGTLGTGKDKVKISARLPGGQKAAFDEALKRASALLKPK